MRKDTRIGVAIGLVLFAVLIAYAVVGNKTNSKKKVTLDTHGKPAASTEDLSVRGGASSSGSAAGEGRQAATGDTIPAPLAGVETADPSAAPNNSGANWAALLSATEKFDALRTKTPEMEKRAVADSLTSAKGGASGGVDVIPRSIGGSTDTGSVTHNTSRNATTVAGAHKVEQGETFVSIARAVYGDGKYASDIARANPNVDPRRMRAGTTIVLPDKAKVVGGTSTEGATPKATIAAAKLPAAPGKEYAVQADDSLYKISVKVYGKGDKVDAIYELNKQLIGPDSGRLRPGMVLKLPPAIAAVTTVSSAVH